MIGLIILFTLAGALSSVWLGTSYLYLDSRIGWDALLTLPPPELATYLLATFGPLAALWLILGFFHIAAQGQRQEQVLQTLAGQARRNAEQTEAQVRTLIEMQSESRRRSLLGGLDLVIKDMNGQAALLAERLGMVSEQEADALWARTVSGDLWAFAHAFLIRSAAYSDFSDMLAERLAGDPVCSAALQTFLRRYDQLTEDFRESETDRLMRQVLEDGPLARLQALFADVNARAVRLRMLWSAPPPPEPTAGDDSDPARPEVYPVPEFQPPHHHPHADHPPTPAAAATPPVGGVVREMAPAGVAAIVGAAAGLASEDQQTLVLGDDADGFGDEFSVPPAPDAADDPAAGARSFLQQIRQAEAVLEDASADADASDADSEAAMVSALSADSASLQSSMNRLNDALRRLNSDGSSDAPAATPQGDLLATLEAGNDTGSGTGTDTGGKPQVRAGDPAPTA